MHELSIHQAQDDELKEIILKQENGKGAFKNFQRKVEVIDGEVNYLRWPTLCT